MLRGPRITHVPAKLQHKTSRGQTLWTKRISSRIQGPQKLSQLPFVPSPPFPVSSLLATRGRPLLPDCPLHLQHSAAVHQIPNTKSKNPETLPCYLMLSTFQISPTISTRCPNSHLTALKQSGRSSVNLKIDLVYIFQKYYYHFAMTIFAIPYIFAHLGMCSKTPCKQ